MKYGYQGADSGELIKGYSIDNSNGTITIEFLDGTKFDTPVEDLNRVKETMLQQAIERNESNELQNTKRTRTRCLRLACINSTLLLNFIIINIESSYKLLDIMSSIGILTVLATEEFSLNRYSNLTEKIKELEKYDIYLSIREKLEQLKDNELDITTIDNYSLKDLKQIRNQLIIDAKNERFYNEQIRTKKIK